MGSAESTQRSVAASNSNATTSAESTQRSVATSNSNATTSAESTQRSVAASNSNGTTYAGSSRRENEDDHELKKEDIIIAAGALTGAAIAVVGYGLYRFLSNNKADDDQEDNNKDEEGENQKMMLAAPSSTRPSVVKYCSWRRPRQGYCSLNCDGSRRQDGGRLGGVIRDEGGETKLMYSAAVVERYDIFTLELLAVLKGIECAAMINISKLEIGSDNEQVVNVINQEYQPRGKVSLDILDKINKLRSQVEVVEVYHIYREANKMANFLACRSGPFRSPFGITIATPPLERDLCVFAKEDAMGVSYRRYK